MELVRELQKNIDIVSRPFLSIASRLGISEVELLDWARQLQRAGVMRRYGAVLRHRRAGYGANAMTCWRVPPERVDEVGQILAAFPGVTHCYERPTYPDWPYNVFAMIHGRTEQACVDAASELAEATGISDYVVLFSTREYKKVRVQYFEEGK